MGLNYFKFPKQNISMELPIRVLVVVILALIALLIFLALFIEWGGQGSSLWDHIVEWFKNLLPR